MHFLIDENISKAVVLALRERGHDVSFVKEEIRGAADKVVLSKAMAENRVLVTRDKELRPDPIFIYEEKPLHLCIFNQEIT